MSIPSRQARLLSIACWSAAPFLIFSVAGCGGGSPPSASPPPPSGPPPGPPFQPRPFLGDYYVRLSPQTLSGRGDAFDAIYNPVLKQVFVSNPDNNAVEVFSSIDARKVGEISIPGPTGLSFFPDYSSLVIGTISPYMYLADPFALHVTEQIEVPESYLGPEFELGPVRLYAMADGSIMIGMGTATAAARHLVRYDPSDGTFAYQDPGGDSSVIYGIYANPARSGDGKSLIVTGPGNGITNLFLYSTSVKGYVASASVPGKSGANSDASLAANADGTQFAALLQTPAPLGTTTTQVDFWGPNLQVQGQYTYSAAPPSGRGVFSRDGHTYMLTCRIAG